MGCGNSKLNPEGELVPPRIRPLLLRSKFSEFRKRKNGINLRDGALSKKVLLNDGERELEEENGSQNSLALQQHTKQIPLSNNDDLEHNQDKTMDEHKYVQEGDENNKPGEEARPDSEENRCFICPGSPSFRVYFVEETKNDKENVEEMKDAGMEDVSHKKSPSRDSVESTTSAKVGEDQENKMIKKGKKGTNFNRVISKKRPVGVGVGVGVKNLLNVKSCYHLSCSGNDRANLLARKAEA